MAAIDDYLASHASRFEAELCELLRIESISADSQRRSEMEQAAAWVADQFRSLDLATEVIPTDGWPLVYAESPAQPGVPTVLVYGHYDVQPADPLDQWVSPPFEPACRAGQIFARGASDDKGQMFTHLKSAEAWLRTAGHLPVRLKFIIEGEEEIGSANLIEFVRRQSGRLACDVIVISDGAQFGPDQPAITYGLRGIAYYELRVQGPNRDLHSGSFGGAVTNPANAVAAMLAGLVDGQGRVQIPGFYDDVVELSERERSELARLPFDEGQFLRELGVDVAGGEHGYTLLERRWARPSYDVSSLWGGYQGEGAKTVLPATAGAKFSFRLVPNQDPAKVTEGLRRRLSELCPPGVRFELIDHHCSPAVVVSLESPYVEAAARAIARAFGCRPVYTREGGSIPIVATLHEALRADVLLLGWGQPDDNAHSPNEKFALADFHRAIRASAALWEEIARAAEEGGKS